MPQTQHAPPKRGGARPNAGRKPRTSPDVRLFFSFPENQVQAIGGAKELRKLIREYFNTLVPQNSTP